VRNSLWRIARIKFIYRLYFGVEEPARVLAPPCTLASTNRRSQHSTTTISRYLRLDVGFVMCLSYCTTVAPEKGGPDNDFKPCPYSLISGFLKLVYRPTCRTAEERQCFGGKSQPRMRFVWGGGGGRYVTVVNRSGELVSYS
jgi:hypothetical protein